MIKLRLNKRKGFTIVELIIVMAIIAILTLIAVPMFKKYLTNAEKTKEVANAKTCYSAAISAVIDENISPTGTYNTPGFDSSGSGLSHDSALYKKIYELTNITNENLEVYTVRSGNTLKNFNYVHVDTESYSEQIVDEWSIIIPITGAKNASIDPHGDIYIIPPGFKSERWVYKNGANTNILLSEYPDPDSKPDVYK